MFEDHALHVYILGGPDFIVGPDAPAAQAQRRRRDREGRRRGRQAGHRHAPAGARADRLLRRQGDPPGARPARRRVEGPGARPTCRSSRSWRRTRSSSRSSRSQVFKDIVLKNPEYVKLITSDAYTHKTYYMGMVDAQQQGELLRRPDPRRGPDRQGVREVPGAEVPRLRRRARRAVELHQVLLPEAAGLEGLRGRAARAASTRSRRWRG